MQPLFDYMPKQPTMQNHSDAKNVQMQNLFSAFFSQMMMVLNNNNASVEQPDSITIKSNEIKSRTDNQSKSHTRSNDNSTSKEEEITVPTTIIILLAKIQNLITRRIITMINSTMVLSMNRSQQNQLKLWNLK